MSPATSPHPASLAELLDGRPDTREMISANLDLAHACLELKQGDSSAVERILDQARQNPSPEIDAISTCIRAEALRLSGRESEAWDMAEELVARDRFDTVAALYLRFLFPFHAGSSAKAAAVHPADPETAPPPPPRDPASATALPQPSSLVPHDIPSQSFHDPDSDVSLAIEHDPSDDSVPVAQGELPPALAKLSQDESVRLLRLRAPDGSVSETVRSPHPIGDLDAAIVDRPASILQALQFGRMLHASFEGGEGAAHAWARSGRTLYLVVGNSTNAPALAARCSRAMEDLA